MEMERSLLESRQELPTLGEILPEVLARYGLSLDEEPGELELETIPILSREVPVYHSEALVY